MKGFVIPEQGHIVNILPPIDVTGGVNSDVFSMRHAGHVDIIISMGVQALASTITVEECDNFTPSNHTAIAFDYYYEDTSNGDTLSDRTAATSAGISSTTDNNIFKVISIDASQLTDGYPCLRVCFSDPGGSAIISAVAVLSGQRYQEENTPTAIV
jgi:hypothetical protein